MRVRIGTILAAPFDRVCAEICLPRSLIYIAAPIVGFAPIDPFPDRWAERSWRVAIRLLGMLPLGSQRIVITFPPAAAGTMLIRDNGIGDLARRWDHLITLHRRADGTTDYLDEVDIAAGVLTPFVCAFAMIFYRHRQRRWHRLVARNFAYD